MNLRLKTILIPVIIIFLAALFWMRIESYNQFAPVNTLGLPIDNQNTYKSNVPNDEYLGHTAIDNPDIQSRPTNGYSSTADISTHPIDTVDRAIPYNPYPYYTWEEKLAIYYAGRPVAAVPYPNGLDYQGVQQLSDNVYAIDREKFLQQSGTQDLLSQAQFTEQQDGKVRLAEVVPGGIYDRMGMLPGDQLQTINGTTIRSYADLYTAYQGIDGKPQVTMQIGRNNLSLDFTYFVQ